jgi:hypothetical protein
MPKEKMILGGGMLFREKETRDIWKITAVDLDLDPADKAYIFSPNQMPLVYYRRKNPNGLWGPEEAIYKGEFQLMIADEDVKLIGRDENGIQRAKRVMNET